MNKQYIKFGPLNKVLIIGKQKTVFRLNATEHDEERIKNVVIVRPNQALKIRHGYKFIYHYYL